MYDLIRICDLEVWSAIGVPDAEREQAQRLLVSLELRIRDIGPAAYTDNLRLTVDYGVVAQRVQSISQLRPRRLLETLAEEIAADLLKAFAITSLTLEIKKFVLPEAQHVAICIERPKGGRDATSYRPSPSTSLRMEKAIAPNSAPPKT